MSQNLGVGGFRIFDGRSFGIEMLELSRFNLALPDKIVDFGLLQANDAAKSIGRKLSLIDQPVKRARRQTQSRRRLFSRKPITICLSHTDQDNSISTPLGHFCSYSMHGGHKRQGEYAT